MPRAAPVMRTALVSWVMSGALLDGMAVGIAFQRVILQPEPGTWDLGRRDKAVLDIAEGRVLDQHMRTVEGPVGREYLDMIGEFIGEDAMTMHFWIDVVGDAQAARRRLRGKSQRRIDAADRRR